MTAVRHAPSSVRVHAPGVGAVVVVALVAVLCGLDAAGLSRLGGWCEVDPDRPHAVLFAAYLVTWLVARQTRGTARRSVLLIGSSVTACLFDAWFAVGSIAWVVAFHRVVFAGRRVRPGLGLAFAITSFVGLGLACSRDLWPDFLDAHPELGRWGYLFAVSYTFRIAWLRRSRSPSAMSSRAACARSIGCARASRFARGPRDRSPRDDRPLGGGPTGAGRARLA